MRFELIPLYMMWSVRGPILNSFVFGYLISFVGLLVRSFLTLEKSWHLDKNQPHKYECVVLDSLLLRCKCLFYASAASSWCAKWSFAVFWNEFSFFVLCQGCFDLDILYYYKTFRISLSIALEKRQLRCLCDCTRFVD